MVLILKEGGINVALTSVVGFSFAIWLAWFVLVPLYSWNGVDGVVGGNGLSPHIISYEQGHNGARGTACTQARYNHTAGHLQVWLLRRFARPCGHSNNRMRSCTLSHLNGSI